MRDPLIVIVEKRDEFPLCLGNSPVPGIRRSGAGSPWGARSCQYEPAVESPPYPIISIENGWVGTIIDHYRLEIPEGLPGDAPEGDLEMLRTISRGSDDGDFRTGSSTHVRIDLSGFDG